MERSAEIIVARMNDRIAVHLLVGVESIERLGVELRIFFTVENNCKGMATRISLCLPLTGTLIVEVDNIESLFRVYFKWRVIIIIHCTESIPNLVCMMELPSRTFIDQCLNLCLDI